MPGSLNNQLDEKEGQIMVAVDTSYEGYIDKMSKTFDNGVIDLQTQITEALENLSQNPSDPSLLATYQSKLYEYQLYRTAQSNTIKAFKDLDASIIQNYR